MALEVREIKERLEPTKKPMDAKDMGEIYSQNPRLLPDKDSNLDTQDQNLMSYH
jgi:hypothetical protein